MGSQDVSDEIPGSAIVEHRTAVVLRPKRQVTLPKKICDQLGVEPGDVLEMAYYLAVAVITRENCVFMLK